MKPLQNIKKFVQQIDDRTCVPACLSMITGEPIEAILRFMKEKLNKEPPFSEPEMITYLVNKNYFVQPMNGVPWCHFYKGVHLVTCCSLNFTNLKHQVLVVVTEEGMAIVDPQTGRENKEWFNGDEFDDPNEKFNWSNPMLVFDCNVDKGEEDVTL